MPMHLQWSKDRNHIVHLSLQCANSDVNILHTALVAELETFINQLTADPEVAGLVITSAKQDFLVGASLDEIRGFDSPDKAMAASERLSALFSNLSQLKLPTVAVISGACLGAGLELALACTWRLASAGPTTRLGLPEIHLGLIPGAGGTQRLPRLIGLQTALDMILTGRKVSGKKALKSGLVDACVPPHLLSEQALAYATRARRRVSSGLTSSSNFSKDLPKWAIEGNPIGRKVMFKKARDLVDEKTQGFYPASYKALEAVFDGYDLPLSEGCKLESTLFAHLLMSRQSQCLLHLFHAKMASQRHPYIGAEEKHFGPKAEVKLVGIVGAGLMGSGISLVCADHRLKVRLADPNKAALGRALKSAHTYFSKKVDRRRIQTFEMHQRLAFISPALETTGFKSCDLVLEAVDEDLELKQALLRELEAEAPESWIFASNTSTMAIADIAAVASRPERVIGMHFFSPVEKVALVEVVATPFSADWALARAIAFGRRLGKQVIVVQDRPGFYTTRTLAFYLAEALLLLEEGVRVEVIDQALSQFGFPLGPLRFLDEVGLDAGLHVLASMAKAYGPRLQLAAGLASLIASGRQGKKNQRGFYRYGEGEEAETDQEVSKLCHQGGSSRDDQACDEVVERCVLAFVNEAATCLGEGVLAHPCDGDLGAVYGLGFPPFWGGPFKYIDMVGASNIVENLLRLEEKYGKRFTPSPLLVDYAQTKKKFYPSEQSQIVRL